MHLQFKPSQIFQDENENEIDGVEDVGKLTKISKLYPKPQALSENASSLEKQLYSCMQNLHDMEDELCSIEQVNDFSTNFHY